MLENLGWIGTAALRGRTGALDQRVVEFTGVLVVEHKAIATIAAGSTTLLTTLPVLATLTTLPVTLPVLTTLALPVRPTPTTILHTIIISGSPVIINGYSASTVSGNSDKAGR